MTLVGTSSALDLAAIAPTRWIAQGATLSVPLTVEALDLGVPKANVVVNYTITQGTASLSSGTATTNGAGLATVTAQLTNLNAMVQVSACVAPGNNPCQTFTFFATSASLWRLEAVSGTWQVVPDGQSFQSLVMRATDGSAADNPVLGVTVTFVTTLERNPQGGGGPPPGDSYQGGSGTAIILGTSQTQVVSDQNGLASIVPTVGSVGPCDVYITVTAGSATAQLESESVDPVTVVPKQPHKRSGPGPHRRVAHYGAPIPEQQDATTMLVAVPEAMPSADPPQNVCAGVSQDPPCDAGSDSVATGAPVIAHPASATPAAQDLGSQASVPSSSTDVPTSPLPVESPAEKPAQSAQRPDPSGATAAGTPAGKSAANIPLDDKRSCRFAQAEQERSP
jgi:hypothetical protein